MQDATAQMALLQFMNAGKKRTAVPTTVHCDHLIQAFAGANADLETAQAQNRESLIFCKVYPINMVSGSGNRSRDHTSGDLENYAFPGGMMIGTDSHTVNAGGLG
jgi:aconitate hydratase